MTGMTFQERVAMFGRAFRRAAPLALIPAIGRSSVAQDHADSDVDDSVILVIDIGSSSVRCSAFDTKARMLPNTLRREHLSLSHTGTMDPAQIKERAASVISQCLAEVRRPLRYLHHCSPGPLTGTGRLRVSNSSSQPLTGS